MSAQINDTRRNADGTVTINVTCLHCEEQKEVTVREDGYVAWQQGAMVQVAMPDVSADERELLISGICGTCFDNLPME